MKIGLVNGQQWSVVNINPIKLLVNGQQKASVNVDQRGDSISPRAAAMLLARY